MRGVVGGADLADFRTARLRPTANRGLLRGLTLIVACLIALTVGNVRSAQAPAPTAAEIAAQAPPILVLQGDNGRAPLLDEPRWAPVSDQWAWNVGLPRNRLILFYGSPLSAALGPLGAYESKELVERLHRQAAAFDALDPEHPTVAGFDLVDPVAQPTPQGDGSFTLRMDARTVDHFVDLASANRMYFFFDLQLGRSTVDHEIDLMWPWIQRANVEISLDPEFAMRPGETPGIQFGTMHAAEINRLIVRLSNLVRAQGLPDKVLLIHQFIPQLLPDREQIQPLPGVQVVICEDGVGSPGAKTAGYNQFAAPQTAGLPGFKVFYALDKPAMTEKDVMGLSPAPLVVMYQ